VLQKSDGVIATVGLEADDPNAPAPSEAPAPAAEPASPPETTPTAAN